MDWESIRGLPKGKPSPLREYARLAPARLAPARATVVKGFAQDLADRHGVDVWEWSSPYTGGWELDWERRDGAPTKEQVKTELAADPQAASYAAEITLCPQWGRLTRKARQLLQPDVAVVIDPVMRAEPCLTRQVGLMDRELKSTRSGEAVSHVA
ncbi:hypothetical protein [Streptomyces longisporoflavus]|uniref:Uncharacterized protein n=1 Tax=Streptomyces longisporoflavus TaxID=28044 RepID=A0ABW7R357_9ACTN